MADPSLLDIKLPETVDSGKPVDGGGGSGGGTGGGGTMGGNMGGGGNGAGGSLDAGMVIEGCAGSSCQWLDDQDSGCESATVPDDSDRPSAGSLDSATPTTDLDPLYFAWTQVWLGETTADNKPDNEAWSTYGFDLDGVCTASDTCDASAKDTGSCKKGGAALPIDGNYCIDNAFARLQPIAKGSPELGGVFGITEDAVNCSLFRGSYNLLTKLSGYNGTSNDNKVRIDFYASPGLATQSDLTCPEKDYRNVGYSEWTSSQPWLVAEADLAMPMSTASGLGDSVQAVTDAFVVDSYLVARLDNGFALLLAGDRADFPSWALTFKQAVYVGKLVQQKDSTWTIEGGLLAGIQAKGDLSQSFANLGVCSSGATSDVFSTLDSFISEGVDTLSDGSVQKDKPCDAMSTGILFHAKTAKPGDPFAVAEVVDCCDPQNADAPACADRCGDGVVSGSEICDVAIAAGDTGACDTTCSGQQDPCNPNVLLGDFCSAHCGPKEIITPVGGDGCCPTSANASNDDDCSVQCGNGVVEAGETCDPPGSCPKESDCPSTGDPCNDIAYSGSPDTCDALCSYAQRTACVNGDNCCPTTCSDATDSSCPSSLWCPDAMLSPVETCDPDIPTGDLYSCPTSCPDQDGDACTLPKLVGAAAQCTARCTEVPVTTCDNGDGCCLSTCNANNDNDCSAKCGNAILESGEECDDGNNDNQDGCAGCKLL